MAGTLKTNAVQLGDSATATQNLTIRTNADGTFTIARGNVGATTQDVLTIDANGIIAQPQSVVAFSVYSATLTSVNSFTRMTLDVKEFDTRSRFNNTAAPVNGIPAYSFMPDVPGYYQVQGTVHLVPGAFETAACLYKNGVNYKIGSDIGSNASAANVSALVYLNGTTDYLTLFGYSGVATNSATGITRTVFNGTLIAKA
jgi:hypothetical protein